MPSPMAMAWGILASRRAFCLWSIVAAGPLRAATPPTGRRRLGVLLFDSPSIWAAIVEELRIALAGLGWREGVNLAIDWRYAEGDASRLPSLAEALVRSGAEVLMTRGTPATRALQQATKAVPIATGVGDPIGLGFAASLAEPGGNITGLSWAEVEVSTKRVELLRELMPRLEDLTLVFPSRLRDLASDATRAPELAARRSGIKTRVVLVGSMAELRDALRTSGGRSHAAYMFGIADIAPHDIATSALQAGTATMFPDRVFVDGGGLISYRLDWINQTQRTAIQIDKLLRGADPARLPFELPTHADLALNARTAQALGIVVPRALVVRADKVFQ
jgi:putative ABC transport system substrate-binding protein